MANQSLNVTLIQPDIVWEDKPANLRQYEQYIAGIRERREVVVLPEMFSTGFSMAPEGLAEGMDGATVQWMKDIARQYRCILTGSLIIEEEGRFLNRLVWMQPDGKYGYYDKRHLFAYAREHEHYHPGTKRLIAQVKGWKICLQVCYDLRFPVWARQRRAGAEMRRGAEDAGSTPEHTGMSVGMRTAAGDGGNGREHTGMGTEMNAGPEYDVLLYVANWPEVRSLAWKTLLQARAIENMSYTIGVNRVGKDGKGIYHSGDSSVFGPMGELLWQRSDAAVCHTVTLDKEMMIRKRERFPFLEDADPFMIL